MAALCNGMHAYGMLRPFCATFLNFFGYAAGAVRVSALSHFGVLYIATHDSIGLGEDGPSRRPRPRALPEAPRTRAPLGEDGPTHQPVEALVNLRATPNLLTLRPADANEVVGAYMVAMERPKTPAVIALSRQGCANLAGSRAEAVARGAYVLRLAAGGPPQLVLVGTCPGHVHDMSTTCPTGRRSWCWSAPAPRCRRSSRRCRCWRGCACSSSRCRAASSSTPSRASTSTRCRRLACAALPPASSPQQRDPQQRESPLPGAATRRARAGDGGPRGGGVVQVRALGDRHALLRLLGAGQGGGGGNQLTVVKRSLFQ